MAEKKEIVNKIVSYLTDVIEKEREEFGGLATCPFAKAERQQNKILIAKWDRDVYSLHEMVRFISDFGYESALFALFDGEDPVDLSSEDSQSFQQFINRILKSSFDGEYRCICINPNDTFESDGFNPRSESPYLLVNIAKKKVLVKANKSLKKTNYYDKMTESYKRYLKLDL